MEANVGSFMCSYNKINKIWSCENPETLKRDLKEHLGFNGWVMSDWGATHSLSISAGLDQEMPGSEFFGNTLQEAVNSGAVLTDTVDEAVMRILTPMFTTGLFDDENTNTIENYVRSEEHSRIAREIGAAAHVLLKNDNQLLPLKVSQPLKIALFGGAARSPIVSGGGSGSVFAAHIVTPYEGIMGALGIVDSFPVIASCNSSSFLQDVKVLLLF